MWSTRSWLGKSVYRRTVDLSAIRIQLPQVGGHSTSTLCSITASLFAKERNTMLNAEPKPTSDILSENGPHHTSIAPALPSSHHPSPHRPARLVRSQSPYGTSWRKSLDPWATTLAAIRQFSSRQTRCGILRTCPAAPRSVLYSVVARAAALTNTYSRQLRNLNPGRRAPAHLIGDDLARYGAVDLAGNPMTHRAQRDPQLR